MKKKARLAIKVDVDTDRGTRIGVLRLVEILKAYAAPASFLFSLGPDNTGKAIRRVLKPGFLKKVSRTNVRSNYGIRTLLNGTLMPAPMIGRRNDLVMRSVHNEGFECGVHSWDHYQWQDHVHGMPKERIKREMDKAIAEFSAIFDAAPKCAGAPGWQCNAKSLQVYDESNFTWASDTRVIGTDKPIAFYPKIGDEVFKTLHVSTTLPTLDELLGRPEFPEEKINEHLISLIKHGGTHVHTIHAEMEGLNYAEMFTDFLKLVGENNIEIFGIGDWAQQLLDSKNEIPVCPVEMAEIDGRSGTVAVQR